MGNRIFINELDLKDGKYYQVMANEGLWSPPLKLKEMLLLIKRLTSYGSGNEVNPNHKGGKR